MTAIILLAALLLVPTAAALFFWYGYSGRATRIETAIVFGFCGLNITTNGWLLASNIYLYGLSSLWGGQ